jgi:glycosyltransferase involved in cell wall biosynthesis
MVKRLRIAVISRVFSRSGGGAESYSVAVVDQLAARHDIHVFAQETNQPVQGVHYHPVFCLSRKPRWINQLLFAIATWIQTRKGFDVVHSHENTWHGQVQTVHVRPLRYNLFHGREGFRRVLRWLKVALSPRLLTYVFLEGARFKGGAEKKLVVTSESLLQEARLAYPLSGAALSVIAPGTQLPSLLPTRADARAKLGLPPEQPLVLFVANDYARKGLDALLQALALLPSEVGLIVVGHSGAIPKYQQKISALKLNNRVFFLGSLNRMTDAYCAANCLAHPTLEDSFAMVVLEAMAHGLPMVVSGPQYCGISRQLDDRVHALLLQDPKNPRALADAIDSVLTDKELTNRLCANGQTFAQLHSWEDVALRFESLYLDVATRRPRWLVLAHAFNMDGRAASQTITDKLPHLVQAGIEVVVLSGVSGRQDHALEHHQSWPMGPAGFRFELRHVLRKRVGSGVVYRILMTLASLVLLPGMLIEKILRPVESSWSWWLSAYLKGRQLARKQPFDLIYSSGGAFGAHVAADALKRATGTPWLAEVHDPMVVPGSTPTSAQQKMQAKVEQLICSNADIAVWFTNQALSSARLRHPQLANRGKMMLPGIDRPFTDLPPYQAGNKFVIGHFGSLSPTRHLGPLLEALELLRQRRSDALAHIEVHVYGGPLDSVSAERLAHSAVGSHVRHFGRIEADPVTGISGREQILRRMRAVDVLLLLHGEEPICAEYIPSKLYEYLWMQRPILALVHQNPQMADMARGQGHVVVAAESPSVSADLSNAIEKMWDQWRTAGLADNCRASPFTTETAATQLLGWVRQLPVRSH